jgi:hypothetical protein
MLRCPRCQRANPDEAVFCHFDGAELRPAHGDGNVVRTARLPHEFVFPSGRRCTTYDELAQGCQEEWEVARGLLQQGAFRHFLTGLGRMDLAHSAQKALSQPDADSALDSFVNTLPVTTHSSPKLDLSPRRFMLGSLRAGERREVHLTILNHGKGLLRGTLTIGEGGTWLLLGDGSGRGECQLRAAREQDITLIVDTRGLPAPQTYSSKLTVISNGGVVEVPVRLDLTVNPFPHGPFQGAASTREIAERMKAQPKAAAPLLESGAIARWFASNGWTYPVQGETAKGVAAVQQFFEGMGLSKPPPVHLSEQDVHVRCHYPETVGRQVVLRTEAKKWVYAHVRSTVPWLRPTAPQVSGPQQAVIPFEVDSRLLAGNGAAHEGRLQVAANAGQQLTVRVRVEVEGAAFAELARPRVERPPEKPPEPEAPRVRRPFVAGALTGLLLRLFLAVPGDLYARVVAAPPGPTPAGGFATWLEPPVIDGAFVRPIVLTTWWLGAVVGFLLLRRRGGRPADTLGGLIAGAVFGLVGSATLACLLPALDAVPRGLWGLLGRPGGPAWVWTPLWVGLAAGWWALVGGAVGWLRGRRAPAS